MVEQPRKAIVIGGGPTGIVISGLLAKKGWKVDLFEKESRQACTETAEQHLSRAYAISTSARTLEVLDELDARQDVLDEGGYYRYNTFVHAGHKIVAPLKQVSFTTLSVVKTQLVCGLLKAVERQFSHLVHISFENGCVSAGLAQDTEPAFVTVERSGPQKLTADLIVFADGWNSCGRACFLRDDPLFQSKVEPSITLFKTIVFKPLPAWPARSSHFWMGWNGLTIIGRENIIDNTLLCLMAFKKNTPATASDLTGTDLRSLLAKTFTKVQLPLDDVVTQEELNRVAAAPSYDNPNSLTCSHYNHRNVVLLGDAAQSVPINVAHGTNAALQSALQLAAMLDSDDDVDLCLARYSNSRKPEMDALQRMMKHPFLTAGRRSRRGTWKHRLLERLRRWTGLPYLAHVQTQLGLNELSYVEVERNMLWQQATPVVVAGSVGVVSAGLWVLWVRALLKLRDK